jgi:hypothetical protein
LEGLYPVRDITDREFLALAVAADADFLVTNDRRHFLPLKRFGRTQDRHPGGLSPPFEMTPPLAGTRVGL